VGPSFGSVGKLRRFISSCWYEVTGKVSQGHRRAGTRVEDVKKWKEATSYVERYMAKPEDFPEGLQTGRIWGIWNEKHLPVRWETVEVSLRDAFRIRRIYRKLARKKGSGSRTRCPGPRRPRGPSSRCDFQTGPNTHPRQAGRTSRRGPEVVTPACPRLSFSRMLLDGPEGSAEEIERVILLSPQSSLVGKLQLAVRKTPGRRQRP
jgi:hypothetical protein